MTHYDIDRLVGLAARRLADGKGLSMARIGDALIVLQCADGIDGYGVEWLRGSIWAREVVACGLPRIDQACIEKYRDDVLDAIRNFDIVGVLELGDKLIRTEESLKRPLLDSILKRYGLILRDTCDAALSRYISRHESFWDLLRGNRFAFVSNRANTEALHGYLNRHDPMANANYIEAVEQNGYADTASTLAKISASKCRLILGCVGFQKFDIARRAKETGRVFLDVGQIIQKG